jgi:hypothetical protein
MRYLENYLLGLEYFLTWVDATMTFVSVFKCFAIKFAICSRKMNFNTKKISTVETRNNAHTRAARLRLILFLKILAHFRSKVLVVFYHSVTQINCLTGAIISETYIRHILRINIFTY